MKKVLKVLLIIILILFLAILLVPVLFKSQILSKVKEEINKNVNAKVEFADFQLSLIKGFPNFYVGLKELSVVGLGDFANDTLVAFDAFEVKVDLMSVIKMDSINVKTISLINPTINAIVLEDGRANWDIAPESTDTVAEEVDTTTSEPLNMSVKLKRFEIVNANISYDDQSSNMKAALKNFNFTLTGDLSEKLTTLVLKSNIEKINFIMDGIKYMRDGTFDLLVDVEADMENSVYTIKENSIYLNGLTLGTEGVIKMPNETDIVMDLKYFTKNTEFKTLLSMVPAIYLADFDGLETAGTLKLDGYVKGIMNDNVMPLVGLDLKVNNAMFKYPDLPEKVDKIGIDLSVLYNGVDEDSTTVDLNKFHLEIAGNPVDMTMNIKTPMSDMHVNGNLKTDMDLASLKNAMPLEGMSVSGTIKTNLDMMGYMSSIEEERYEEFKADGSVKLNELVYRDDSLPYDVTINAAALYFSPKFVELASFDANIGKSDVQLYGKIENFIPYVFKDETIKGKLRLTSGLLDLNEFMTEGEEEEVVEEEGVDTIPMTVVEVPKNIDFTFSSNLAKVIFDKLEIDDITGAIEVKDGAVNMKNLSMNMLDGFMVLNGEYNTSDMANPIVDFKMDITDFDIPKTVEAFNTIEKLAPAAKSATGKVSTSLSFTSFLDQEMSPVMNSIVSSGNLSSKTIGITNSNMFGKIGEKLGTDKFKDIALNDVDLHFEIREGKLFVDPFDVKLGKGTAIIGGDQGLDQSLNYTIKMMMPRTYLGGAANNALNSLTSNAVAQGLNITPDENLNLDIKVGGTVTEPDVKLDLKENAKQTTQAVKEEVKKQVKAEVDKKKDEAKAKAKEQADRIMANAKKQADQIRAAAKKTAETTKAECYKQAQQIEDKVKGQPKIAQKVAQKSADEARKKCDQQAAKTIAEGDKKAQDVLDKAQKEADRLNP